MVEDAAPRRRAIWHKPLLRRAFIATLALGIVAAAYLFGFVTRDKSLFPTDEIVRFRGAVKALLRPDDATGVVARQRLETATLELDLLKIKAPIDDAGAGGALTSARDELVLLSRFGDLFLIQDDVPTRLGIAPPNNQFSDYLALTEQAEGTPYTHNPDSIRFNDVLFLPTADGDFLVLSYTEWRAEESCYDTAVARLALPAGFRSLADVSATVEDWEVVFRTRPCLPLKTMMRAIEGHMAGGRLAPAGDGAVYLGSGDYHWDGVYAPEALAQDDANDYGKVLKIDLTTGAVHHVSRGQRNLQGVVVTDGGELWTTEHGPRGGDELNHVVDGGNYGWPLATLGTRYNRLPWPGASYGRHDAFEGPVYAWVPSIGVSNLMQVHDFDPSWDGDLLVASLRAQSLFRLRVVDGQVRFAEQIVIGERIRYVHQHGDGRLVLWTDSEHLVFVAKSEATPTAEFIAQTIAAMDLPAPRVGALNDAVTYCSECHSFDYLGAGGAPTLASVHGRPVASTDYPLYSPALSGFGREWTSDLLSAYLRDPATAVPGTTMPRPNLSDATVQDLVSLLEALSEAE